MSKYGALRFSDELVRLVFGSIYPHLSEISYEMQAFDEPVEGVDQRNHL